MLQYEIAGIKINMENCFEKYIVDRMSAFKKKFSESSDMDIFMHDIDFIHLPNGNLAIEEPDNLNWVEKPGKEGFFGYKTRKSTGEILDLLETDKYWQRLKILLLDADYYSRYKYDPIVVIAFHLIGTAFRNRILYKSGFVLHASSLICNGRGIIFTAPSGTGKSTQAGLWEKYRAARVLNDDTPALRYEEGTPFVYGTPWSGSSDKFLNEKAPVKAIFILEQAPMNSVRELCRQEAVIRLMPRVFLPYFSNELAELAVSNFEKIIDRIPIYMLKCRPDAEAVELAEKCV